MFLPGGGGDYEASHGLHNGLLDLPTENLDSYTAIADQLAENGQIDYRRASRDRLRRSDLVVYK
jgi:hypothetical protein